ncbi:MAG: glycosyl transferase group 1 [Frankiales bacterium]|nr:glycosyl transferase group 1 [Frankiales bacterium]
MRVALDVTPATTGRTGVARYARELTRELRALDIEVRPFAIGRGPYPAPDGTKRLRMPLRVVQQAWRIARHPTVEDIVGAVDVFHSLDLIPVPSRAPLVMTAHDTAAIERPDLHPPHQVASQRHQLDGWRRAARVVAVSQATADALARLGVDPARISVARHGLTPLPAAGPPVLEQPFLLAVGEVNARKDLPTLIAAFRQADLPEDLLLVLAGPDGFRAEETTRLTGGQVRALGRVEDDVLGALYRDALALCFPTLGEGFGLPVLEAMSAGKPLVVSDLDVLREVAEGAALFVPPGDVTAWSGALERIVRDGELRTRLAEAGRQRAAAATWQATARDTVDAYRLALP